jgi:hypothetical protein
MGETRSSEEVLLDVLAPKVELNRATPIFILGAPRTGSTILYQAICSTFHLPFISNFTNEFFSSTPITGLAIQKGIPVEIGFESRFGKTSGQLQPSEASAVMARWFGGGHPSALVSARILDGMEPHFVATVAAAEALFGAPLVIKNAWNCFRVSYLATTLPSARFIWIRRDISAAAKSDLAARYETKGSSKEWNSATPANVERLRQLPATAQVVENQHQFNIAISEALREHAGGRSCEIWYEDLIESRDRLLKRISTFLRIRSAAGAKLINIAPPRPPKLSSADESAIASYLATHVTRLTPDRYPCLR